MAEQNDVTGFGATPIGYLCEQQWDLTADLAYVHERARTYCKSWHTHDRTMLVCPLGAAQVRVQLRGEPGPARVDSTGVLWVKAHEDHQTEAEGDLYDVLAFYPGDALLETVSRQVGATHPCAEHRAVVLDRDPLLAALLRRFLEAALEGQSMHTDVEIRALGWLILCTALRQSRPCARPTRLGATNPQTRSTLSRVMAAIDADVDRPWTLGDLAKHGHVSRATLVRLFKAALGVAPMAYVQERRLQEAESLLKRGASVTETAHLVGYQSPAAFCSAYRRHFGLAPSKVHRGSA